MNWLIKALLNAASFRVYKFEQENVISRFQIRQFISNIEFEFSRFAVNRLQQYVSRRIDDRKQLSVENRPSAFHLHNACVNAHIGAVGGYFKRRVGQYFDLPDVSRDRCVFNRKLKCSVRFETAGGNCRRHRVINALADRVAQA